MYLHMDALNCSRKNKGAFAVRSVVVKGNGNDDDQNNIDFWEEKNDENREDQTGERKRDYFFAEKKSREKASRRIAESDGEKAKKYHPLKSWKQQQQRRHKRKNRVKFKKMEKSGETKRVQWRMTTMVHKSKFCAQSRSPLKKLLTGKGTLEKGKISPDSILPDNNASGDER